METRTLTTEARAATGQETPAGRFEHAYEALEQLVLQLQAGGLGLDAMLDVFERATALAHECEVILSQAELRVERVLVASLGSESGR